MPDLSGPLFSLSASGTIAKAITYSNWRGIRYARQRVIPTNPRSTDQVKVRSVFSALSQLWKTAPSEFYASYDFASAGKPYTNRNLLVRLNSKNLYDDGDTTRFAFSAEFGGAPNNVAIGVTPGAGTLAITATNPTPPTGWAVDNVWFAVLKDFDPTIAAPESAIVCAADATSPYAHTFTGLDAGDLYRIGVWVEYSHGTPTITAWSPSINDSGTPA